jgi:alpha-1,2-mannosyltransferase
VSVIASVAARSIAGRSLLGVLVLAEAISLVLAVQRTYDEHSVLIWESTAIVIFTATLFVLARLPMSRRAGLSVVFGVGAALQIIAVRRPPVDSDDDFRYLWDGKVQLAGIDPYRYSPSSAALAPVRDGYLFPSGPCGHYPLPDGLCTRINLPTVHTIYPPVAEGAFALVRVLSFGGHGGQFPLQLAAALGVMATAVLLARGGRPLWTVALWAWCPVTIIELSNNAHIDWLAVLLAVAALTASARGRILAAGVLLGAGIATKLYPALLGPALLKRRPALMIGAAVGTVVLVYIPHVLAVGGSVIGYLPTYLNQGGYGDGRQYRLLSLVLPPAACTPVAVVIIGATVVWSVVRSDPKHPERAALVMVGVSMLIATPTLPWYTGLLLALAALNARPEWLAVAVAPTLEYLLVGAEHAELGQATTACYLGALVIVLLVTGWRQYQSHQLRLARTLFGYEAPRPESQESAGPSNAMVS